MMYRVGLGLDKAAVFLTETAEILRLLAILTRVTP